MKYLNLENFEELNSCLSVMNSRDFLIHARIEAYSCKPTDSDKKLKNFIDHKYPQVIELSSSVESMSNREDISRKTLVYLLSTLNAAFPDYDFSEVKPTAFSKTGLYQIKNILQPLAQTLELDLLLESIDSVVDLKECNFYTFHPDKGMFCNVNCLESEPDAEEGNLWSLYVFLFNKKMKRMVFFTARAVSS